MLGANRHTLRTPVKIERGMNRISYRSSSMWWLHCRCVCWEATDGYRYVYSDSTASLLIRVPVCCNLLWQLWSEFSVLALIVCDLIAFPSGCHLWSHLISNVSSWVEMQQIIRHLSGGAMLTGFLVSATRRNCQCLLKFNSLFFFLFFVWLIKVAQIFFTMPSSQP